MEGRGREREREKERKRGGRERERGVEGERKRKKKANMGERYEEFFVLLLQPFCMFEINSKLKESLQNILSSAGSLYVSL